MVKVLDLLTKDEVFEQCRAPAAGLEAGLVPHRTTDIRRHVALTVIHLELLKGLGRLGIISPLQHGWIGERACSLGQA